MRLLIEILGNTKIIQHSWATDLHPLKREAMLKPHIPSQRKSPSINSIDFLIESEQSLLHVSVEGKIKQATSE